MTHTLIVCATFLLALVVLAWFKERKDDKDRASHDADLSRHHEREMETRAVEFSEAKAKREFWADRDLDQMKRDLAAALDKANKAHALGSDAVNRVNEFERGHALGRR